MYLVVLLYTTSSWEPTNIIRLCYFYGTFYIHSVQGDEADINDNIDNNDNNDVEDNNDNNNIFDEDYEEDDTDVEERDTFDLDCDDDVADDFFSSDLFRNVVELLDGEDRPLRPPARPSIRQAATNDDNEDPSPMKPDVFPDENLGHAFQNRFRDGNLKLPFWWL